MAIEKFHQYREIFRTTRARVDNARDGTDAFSFPQQHALLHYVDRIKDFGVLNGLCSSITESKHIKAIKEPWRRSNGYEALGQMLTTNQRLDKLASARVDFEERGMLEGSCLSSARKELGL